MRPIRVAPTGWHHSCCRLVVPKTIKRSVPAGSVLIVSSNLETLDGLTQYFSNAGLPSEARRRANPLAALPRTTRALVVFPDDFPEHEVVSFLFVARTRHPNLKMVVVTRDAQTYEALTARDGRSLRAVVLAKPALGWAILDVIRPAFEVRAALQRTDNQ